jgi:hypothetical protein
LTQPAWRAVVVFHFKQRSALRGFPLGDTDREALRNWSMAAKTVRIIDFGTGESQCPRMTFADSCVTTVVGKENCQFLEVLSCFTKGDYSLKISFSPPLPSI